MNKKKMVFDVLVIGGYGHVGLPLGLTLADSGLRVALYDTDKSKERSILAGKMPFLERDAEPILRRVIGKRLHLAASLADVARSRAVIVTIGTPLDEHLNPRLSSMLKLAQGLIAYLRSDHHIILRSTVYPGTSQRLYDFFIEQGVRCHFSFCPERIAQGYAVRELKKLPQIVSGFDAEAVRRSQRLFERLGVKTVAVSVAEAELSKLFCNAWRYIQFAIVNQFFTMSSRYGADYRNIHKAITYHYERARDFPLPGFSAGPCLLKDTLQLAAFQENNFQLGYAAMMVNEGLPSFIVSHIKDDLKIPLSGAKVGVLGMAFKAETDDNRDSLAYKLVKILSFHGASVMCSDEYVKDPSFVSKEALIKTCDIVIIGAPHSAYRSLRLDARIRLVDIWGLFWDRRPALGRR